MASLKFIYHTDDGVIDMGDFRPHIVIPTSEAHHFYPAAYFERFVKGETVEAIPLDVMRVIVQYWLSGFPNRRQGSLNEFYHT